MEVLLYVFNGFVGALIYFLTLVVKDVKRLSDIRSDETVAQLLLGCLLGYVYYFAVQRLSLPDSFVAIFIGYSNVGIIDTLFTLAKNLFSRRT